MSKEEKKPTIETLEHKGTKVDVVDFKDGRQIFIFQTEKFTGFQIGAFKLGWSNKYAVISPEQLKVLLQQNLVFLPEKRKLKGSDTFSSIFCPLDFS